MALVFDGREQLLGPDHAFLRWARLDEAVCESLRSHVAQLCLLHDTQGPHRCALPS